MNTFFKNLKTETNYERTANGALGHKSTLSKVYDLFSLGAAYRERSDADCMTLFADAYNENPTLALKCLFYLRDVRGGQGERRFFRVCYGWLIKNHMPAAERNLIHIPTYGRWDDLLAIAMGTVLETSALDIVRHQLLLDIQAEKPSLLAKWLPSINTSSKKTRKQAYRVAKYLNLTPAQYRRTLSRLREKLKVLEVLMCGQRWDEIEFDKIPSKAGLLYSNTFNARSETMSRYAAFLSNKESKVNAAALYPYEITSKAIDTYDNDENMNNVLEKYWQNLPNYLSEEKEGSMLCVVDTSASMWGTPIHVAISLGMYCAERAKGPFHNHYISFSRKPRLVEVRGYNFVNKVKRIYYSNVCENTNLLGVFDLLLDVARRPSTKKEDLPKTIVVISDMQIDYGTTDHLSKKRVLTEMELMRQKWANYGYEMPRLIYWNVNAWGTANILDSGPNVSFVSGFSPTLFKQIISGKNGYDLMLEAINSLRYAVIA